MAKSVGSGSAVQVARGAGVGAKRFVAVGNLLGFQQKQFFPETVGKAYEKTTSARSISGRTASI